MCAYALVYMYAHMNRKDSRKYTRNHHIYITQTYLCRVYILISRLIFFNFRLILRKLMSCKRYIEYTQKTRSITHTHTCRGSLALFLLYFANIVEGMMKLCVKGKITRITAFCNACSIRQIKFARQISLSRGFATIFSRQKK